MKIDVAGFVKRHVALMVLATVVIGSGVAFAMGDKEKTYSFRYKMTVEVETPEGIKTGSAVREVTVSMEPCSLCEPEPYHAKVSTKGEAVTVDLGKRGVFFAVMGTDPYMIVFYAFPGPAGLTMEGVKYYSTLKNVKTSLNTESLKKGIATQYPTMVMFKDAKDPKSIELVYQSEAINVQNQANYDYKITDNFEKLFGAGVKLKDITIEMTDEDVTWDVGKYLVWLGQYYDQRLDGERFGTIESKYRLANSLSAGSFSTGEVKNEQ